MAGHHKNDIFSDQMLIADGVAKIFLITQLAAGAETL